MPTELERLQYVVDSIKGIVESEEVKKASELHSEGTGGNDPAQHALDALIHNVVHIQVLLAELQRGTLKIDRAQT